MTDQFQGQGSGGGTDIVTALQGIIRQLTAIVSSKGRITQGTFTMAAAATTVVPQPAVKAISNIEIWPRNAAAAALMGSAKSAYVSAISPATSFTIATANGAAAVGSELFFYQVTNAS